jgi:hypothetical protein
MNAIHRSAPRVLLLSSLFVFALAATLLTPMAPTAQAQSSPNADCSNLSDPSDDGWTDHAQLGHHLQQIEATSHGRVTRYRAGDTLRSPLLYVKLNI